MNDPQTGNWITYNGETYNFKDLRRELDDDTWVSNTDTEVVLRAYAKWGIDAFRKTAGQTSGVAADTFHDRAFDVLTSSKLVEALDVTREPVAIRERYGLAHSSVNKLLKRHGVELRRRGPKGNLE